MIFLDDLFGWIQWYRKWRGGTWVYHCCPDGGWMRREKPSEPFPTTEIYP